MARLSVEEIKRTTIALRAGKLAQTDAAARELLSIVERGLYEGSIPASICDDYIGAYNAAPKEVPSSFEEKEAQLLEELATQLLIRVGFYK